MQISDFWDIRLEQKFNSNLEAFLRQYLIPTILALPNPQDREAQFINAISHYKYHKNEQYRRLASLIESELASMK